MNPFKQTKKQLSIFITAGYSSLESTNEQLELLQEKGVDFVEVGIPFSDPMADGPTIQETSEIALKKGMNLEVLFQQLEQRTSTIPIVLMGYFNPVLSYGITRFLERCQSLGIRSVILPDLSLEIYQRFYQTEFEKRSVFPSFLITPSSSKDQIKITADICRNSFVYLVSSNATTGGSSSFSREMLDEYSAIKALCGDTPMFVGFGIDNRDKVDKIQSVCDGAIIGSAYLKALARNENTRFLDELNSANDSILLPD